MILMIGRLLNAIDIIIHGIGDWLERREIDRLKKLSGKVLDKKYGEYRQLR